MRPTVAISSPFGYPRAVSAGSIRGRRVGRVISDRSGWRVSYAVGLTGDRPAIVSIHIDAVSERRAELTAVALRGLIRPGRALLALEGAGPDGQASATNKGVTWRVELVPDYARRMKLLPLEQSSGPISQMNLNRRERLAVTAYRYVRALAGGDPAPRRTVAKQQHRGEAAVRDDLHAARVEKPPLLLGRGPGRVGGVLTNEGQALVLQVMARLIAPSWKWEDLAPSIEQGADRFARKWREIGQKLGRDVSLNEIVEWESRTGKRLIETRVEEIVATWGERKRRRSAPRKGGKR